MITRQIINFERKIKKFKHDSNYKLQNDFAYFRNFSTYLTTSPLRAYQLQVSFIKCLEKLLLIFNYQNSMKSCKIYTEKCYMFL